MPALAATDCLVLFLMACVSLRVGNAIVLRCYGWIRRRLDSAGGVTLADLFSGCDDSRDRYHINQTIGNLERVLYLYAVFRNQYSLISGWIVLKAFFGWVRETESLPAKSGTVRPPAPESSGGCPSAVAPPQQELYLKYCLYIFGNGLSLAVGIACGEVALILAEAARQLLA